MLSNNKFEIVKDNPKRYRLKRLPFRDGLTHGAVVGWFFNECTDGWFLGINHINNNKTHLRISPAFLEENKNIFEDA